MTQNQSAVAKWVLISTLLVTTGTRPALPQNVVDVNTEGAVAPPRSLDEGQMRDLLASAPRHGGSPRSRNAVRVTRALEMHIREFLDGYPFAPLHSTLGISGYETVFAHPDEMVYALSVAAPYLSRETASLTRAFLREELVVRPPWSPTGYDPRDGQPRESYVVPEGLRASRPAAAGSAFGVFALWAYSHYAGGSREIAYRWPDVRKRMEPILRKNYRFDTSKPHERDEAERFTGDLAGVIGCLRLARSIRDRSTEERALRRAVQMLDLRVNLDRVNPRILEVSKTSASHQLHMSKLARYVDLAPCVGEAIARWTDGVAAARLVGFRTARNGWYIALGPRLIGGENYTSPTHLSRALFDAAVFVERLDSDQLLDFVDIPWCPGDFYFMIKCAYALWADAGRQWESLE